MFVKKQQQKNILLYIGEAENVHQRLTQHIKKSHDVLRYIQNLRNEIKGQEYLIVGWTSPKVKGYHQKAETALIAQAVIQGEDEHLYNIAWAKGIKNYWYKVQPKSQDTARKILGTGLRDHFGKMLYVPD